mgnify:FL=1
MAACRSSGIKTASAVISGERCKLVSIHATYTGAGPPTTISVWDNASAGSGKELARLILRAPHGGDPTIPSATMLEFDMHGVIASNGLYLSISTGTGTGAAVSVEFA